MATFAFISETNKFLIPNFVSSFVLSSSPTGTNLFAILFVTFIHPFRRNLSQSFSEISLGITFCAINISLLFCQFFSDSSRDLGFFNVAILNGFEIKLSSENIYIDDMTYIKSIEIFVNAFCDHRPITWQCPDSSSSDSYFTSIHTAIESKHSAQNPDVAHHGKTCTLRGHNVSVLQCA